MRTWVITFPSVYYALRAEKILKNEGLAVKLIPVPRALSGCCEGLAAQVDEAAVEWAVALLTAAGVQMVRPGVTVEK